MEKKYSGFTLIELIIVIAILAIIAAVAVPRLSGFKSRADETVCAANRKTVENLYNGFLSENENQESRFNKFLIENFGEICPAGGVISYEEEKIKCSVHKNESESNEDEQPEDEVPWL